MLQFAEGVFLMIKYDPIHTNIFLTDLEENIINSGLFSRLQYITQTSTSYFTFPSLKHSRFSHSIGTMHIAGKMFFNIVKYSDRKVITNLYQEIERIIDTDILNSENIIRNSQDADVKNFLKKKEIILLMI